MCGLVKLLLVRDIGDELIEGKGLVCKDGICIAVVDDKVVRLWCVSDLTQLY